LLPNRFMMLLAIISSLFRWQNDFLNIANTKKSGLPSEFCVQGR
jgi:hypothetical protein